MCTVLPSGPPATVRFHKVFWPVENPGIGVWVQPPVPPAVVLRLIAVGLVNEPCETTISFPFANWMRLGQPRRSVSILVFGAAPQLPVLELYHVPRSGYVPPWSVLPVQDACTFPLSLYMRFWMEPFDCKSYVVAPINVCAIEDLFRLDG